jgi:hypothetical protein
MSPMSDKSTGYRKVVAMGNTNHDTSWTIKGLAPGKYYWSVQAIDNCFAGSNFAVEQSFTIQAPGTIIITYPSGGDTLLAGSNSVITYSSIGNSGYVNLDYSTDGGAEWDTIATNQLDDGDYRGWIVPNTPSTNCKIRISDVDGDPSTISDSTFIIIKAVPVELVEFSANAEKSKIILSWKTASEVNNKGFEIERKVWSREYGVGSNPKSDLPDGKAGIRNPQYELVGFVSGAGTSVTENNYSFTDNSLKVSGSYSYRLKQIDYDGSFNYSDELTVKVNLIPEELTLSQNYPNPFNPSTTIRYGIPTDGDVKLVMYGILGNEVAVLVNEKKEAGNYEVVFEGSDLANGIYIYMLQVGNSVQSRKMILLK